MLFLIRGLPGAGKSTLANALVGAKNVVSADDFFEVDGVYRFDAAKLQAAHEWCFNETRWLRRFYSATAVTNTFSRRWEMEPYLTRIGCRVVVIDLFDQGLSDEELAARCVHNVPVEVIAKMRARWEPYGGAAQEFRVRMSAGSER